MTTTAPAIPRADGAATNAGTATDTAVPDMTTSNATPTSTSARILYRPVGLVTSVLGGLLAHAVFKKVWQKAAPGEAPDPPGALDTGSRLKTILLAAGLEGAVFAVVKVVVDRGGARTFQRWSGEWPSD